MRGLEGIGAFALAAALIVGCGDGDDGAAADAAPPTPDAAEIVGMCPGDEPAGATGSLVLYVNFDGVTVTPGMDDAAANTSAIVSAPRTLPPAFESDAQRDIIVGRAEEGVRALFAPFDIGVVLARPTSGTYAMIVVGGDSADLGLGTGIGSVVSSSCDTRPEFVGFVFEGTGDPEGLASQVAFLVGAAAGIPVDQSLVSCMCRSCNHTELCTIPDAIITDDVQDGCGGADEYNPALSWKDKFGCRR